MTVIFALLIFGVLIFVHELGHFMVAKLFKIRVHEFAIGMGPAIFKKQKGETKYSIRCLPIGGFVSLEGEDAPSDDERAFCKKPAYARLLVLVAGAAMNILLGFIVFIIIFSFITQIQVPVINSILPDSPAEMAGLMPGDEILYINGSKVNLQSDVTFSVNQNGEKPIDITVLRGNEKKNITVTPMIDKASGLYKIGFYSENEKMTPGLVIRTAYYNTVFAVKLVYTSLIEIVRGNVGFKDVSGPVGIVNEMGKAAQSGILSVLNLAALIAVNLGVMNLLPLPALDGGRVFFILIEMIRRKPIKQEYESYVHFAGLVLLLLLMAVITFSDVLKLR